MAKEGEYFITSKGRRFLRSIFSDDTEVGQEFSFKRPEHHQLELDYDLDLEDINIPDDNLTSWPKGRVTDRDTLSVLRVIRDEGPYDYDWLSDMGQHEANWLERNGYLKFVSFHRSQDVNFPSKLSKEYRIK